MKRFCIWRSQISIKSSFTQNSAEFNNRDEQIKFKQINQNTTNYELAQPLCLQTCGLPIQKYCLTPPVIRFGK
ncbi:MAG TPA: hypothetical protein DEV81_13330 [Cyanobacteria bacterium UBA11049]|nr:hypothetical protein [Cyanobacteria bacterium UBA11049]